jgi:tetratricopeptide (TPR) repeat protein
MRAATVAIKNTLSSPPSEWKSKLRSGGVSEFLVRQLILTAHRMLDDKPDRAIQVFAVAEELVKELPTLTNQNLLHALRGRTFLDRVVAHRTLGQFPASTTMLDNAEEEYRKTPYCINELAQTWYERAASHFKRGELDATLKFIEQARNIFVLTADRRRAAKARMLEACVLVDRGALRDARDSFREAIAAFRVFEDREALACPYLNLGSTEMRLGHTRTARKALDAALVAFTKQKNAGEVVRAQWNLAHLATFYEKSLLGLRKLRDARRDFAELRMTADAAFVGLDIAKALLDSGEFEEAEQLCGVIFNEFAESGIPKNALEALAYLRDAASRRNADVRLVEDVRRFVERAAFHPEAVFHPA